MTVDADSLAQARDACLDVNKNVVVHACAGSGKTWLLTSRIIRILLDDPLLPLSSILAITFTRNAAAEIRERVTSRLRELRDTDDKQLDALLGQIGMNPDAAMRAKARSLHDSFILARPRLGVRTFDSWFNLIISHLPWEARLNHGRQIVQNASELRSRAWQETVEAAVADPKAGADLKAMLGHHKLPQIRSLLDTMLDKRTEWFLHFGVAPEDEGMEERFMERIDENLPRPDGEELDVMLADKAFYAEIGRVAESMSKGRSKTLLKAANSLAKASGMKGRKSLAEVQGALYTKKGEPRKTLMTHWSLLYDKQMIGEDDLLARLMERIDGALEVERWKTIREYNELACSIGARYARFYTGLKRREGMIDFSDIELVPIRMLVDDPHVDETSTFAGLEMIERMDAQYRHILIDEFQDTSPAQWRVMREWLEMSAGGDNQPSVFIVGDPKQSLYGFRGGNPRLLQAASDYLQENYDGSEIRFNTTRRCATQIVETVNNLFLGVEGLAMEGFQAHDTLATDEPGQVTLLQHSEEKKEDGEEKDEEDKKRTTHLRNPLKEAPEMSEPDRRAAEEGMRIASYLNENLSSLQVPREDGSLRPCGLDDVLLLMPTRANSQAMVDALSASGIPCASVGGTNRLRELECSDVIALLKAIYDPGYGLALAQTLRSPIFSVSEEGLWAVHLAGRYESNGKTYCNWVKGLDEAQGSEELLRARELLGKWRKGYRRDKLPAHETLAQCYHDANVVPRYVAAVPKDLRMRVAQNLEWVLNLAIEAGGGRHAQLSEYAEYLDTLAEAGGDEAFTPPTQSGVLRTMTVHGAKGLESPVVVLANSNYRGRYSNSRLIVGWDQKNLGGVPLHVSFFRFDGDAVSHQKMVVEANKNHLARENLNMLYVAATRAKNLLLVSARPTKNPTYKWGDQVSSALVKLGAEESDGLIVHGTLKRPGKSTGSKAAKVVEEVLEPLEPYSGMLKVGRMRKRETAEMRHGTNLHHVLAMRLAGDVGDVEQRRLLAVSEPEYGVLSDAADRIMAPGSDFGRLLSQSDGIETELPLVDGGKQLRTDCLVCVGKDAWALDFKTGEHVGDSKHVAQLERYRTLIEASGQFDKVHAALVDSDGSLSEIA